MTTINKDIKTLMLQLKTLTEEAIKNQPEKNEFKRMKARKVKLYGRMGGKGPISTRLPDRTHDELEELGRMLGSLFSLEISRSVLISRAVSCYYSYLIETVLKTMGKKDSKKAVIEFIEALESERADLYLCADRELKR